MTSWLRNDNYKHVRDLLENNLLENTVIKILFEICTQGFLNYTKMEVY